MTNAEVRAALARCGLTNEHITSQMRVLSGGENAKVRLCKLMQKKYNGLVLVSHEPEFYEGWITDIWNIEDWTTKIV